MIQQVTVLGAYGGPVPILLYGAPFMSTINFVLQLAGPITQTFSPSFPSQRAQVSDQGVSLVIQVMDSAGNPVNLRLASDIKMILVRPSGVSVEMTASLYTNGFNGQMSISTSAAAPYGTGLDEPGLWLVQGRITTSGNTQFTTVGAFAVDINLGA